MTVKELQDFLSYCDPNASIIITNGDDSHIVETIDVDYVVSKKSFKNWCIMTVKELKTLLESIKNDNIEVIITDTKNWRIDSFKEENCHIINNTFQIHY